MIEEVTAPEVQSMHQNARFFKDEKDRDMIEISFVGSKDTMLHRVKPEHMAKFKLEWDAYCDGRPAEKRKGTPITDLPGMQETRSKSYIDRNVHNLEELAALSDGQCQNLGHGTLTDRNNAQKLLLQRKFEADERARQMVADMSAEIGPRPAEKYAGNSELEQVKKQVADLTNNVAALVAALTEKKKRPKKVTNEPSDDHQ